MKEKLRKKLDSMIQEEQKSEVDEKLLSKLFELAGGDPIYELFTGSERNSLNEFFREVREYLFQQLLTGEYGAQTIVDAVVVLCFETGYKLKGERDRPPL